MRNHSIPRWSLRSRRLRAIEDRPPAHPAKAAYTSFVAKPDKRHHFSTASFDEFNRSKAAHGYR